MELAALGFWIATALGGIYMAGIILRTGHPDSPARRSNLPSAAVFGHGFLALAGLGLWAVHMRADEPGTAWATVAVLVLVLGGGAFMFLRWHKDHKEIDKSLPADEQPLAEQQIPSFVVHLHGALAAVTVLFVVLVAIQATT
jgi:manganese efflux pump family protein